MVSGRPHGVVGETRGSGAVLAKLAGIRAGMSCAHRLHCRGRKERHVRAGPGVWAFVDSSLGGGAFRAVLARAGWSVGTTP